MSASCTSATAQKEAAGHETESGAPSGPTGCGADHVEPL